MGGSVLARQQPFALQPKDHICVVGNTLAERMQHDGWLETMLQARFPQHELVIRNLGIRGDEITRARARRTSAPPTSGCAGGPRSAATKTTGSPAPTRRPT